MAALPFSASCCGSTFDADGMAAHLKAVHPRGIEAAPKSDRGGRAEYPLGRSHTATSLRGDSYRVPKTWKPAPLTAFEKEWLGMTVELSDGRVGQVWSGYDGKGADAAIVVDGALVLAQTKSLRKIASIRKAAEDALFEVAA